MASNFIPRIGLQQRQLPSVPTVNQPAFTGFQSLGAVAETFQKIQNGARNADTAFQISQGRETLTGAYDKLKAEKVDPEEFKQSVAETLQDAYATHLDNITDPAIRSRVEAGLQIDMLKLRNNFEIDYHTKLKDKAEGQFVVMQNSLVNDSVRGNNRDVELKEAEFKTLLNDRVKNGFSNYEDSAKQLEKFVRDVTFKRSTVLIDVDPDAFLSKKDTIKNFDKLNLDDQVKLSNKARTEIDQREKRGDQVLRKSKAEAMNAAEGLANFNRVDSGWLADALADRNPLITPAQARHLQSVNENSSTGGGSVAADTIWDEYTAGARTIKRIERAREELNSLSRDLGRPNKTVLKHKDSLQSDQTTIQNQDIAREANEIQRVNRAVRANQLQYEAEKRPTFKALEKLLGNPDQRNKAMIDIETKRRGDEAGKKLASELAKGQKNRTDSIEKEHGAALEYDGK